MKVFETDRLVLRRLTAEDAPFILEILNDADWLRFIGDRGVRTLDDARHYIATGPVESYARHGFGLFLTALKAGGTPIGLCGLLKRDVLDDVDVGYAFLPQYRGNGYAQEAAAAMLRFARDTVGLARVA
ncbi:MAG TPA: GNAT family N-acetyltransferase, partial [Thermoanaerobaculia bacterium]